MCAILPTGTIKLNRIVLLLTRLVQVNTQSACRDLFQTYLDRLPSRISYRFAVPGIERQDSVYSGLQAVRPDAALVAVHDSARPLLESADAAACMADAQEVALTLKPALSFVGLPTASGRHMLHGHQTPVS